MEKELGKIESVRFGLGGYQDAELGLHICFAMPGSGCAISKGFWDHNMVECSGYAKWAEEDRDKAYAEIMRYISDLLNKAKVSDVSKLKGIPVELSFENRTLKNWRILEEVL